MPPSMQSMDSDTSFLPPSMPMLPDSSDNSLGLSLQEVGGQLPSGDARQLRTVQAAPPSGHWMRWGRLALQVSTLLLAIGAGCGLLWTSKPATIKWLRQYGSIPVIAAIVGWGTNVVAIFLTFYPLEYTGCCKQVSIMGMPLCGWQGIIPANCLKMAEQAVELMTGRLFDVSDTFQRLDPARVAAELRPVLEGLTPRIIETIAQEYAPTAWRTCSTSVQNEIKGKVLNDSQQGIAKAINSMMTEAQADVAQVFDLKEVLIDILTRDKQLVNDIFLKCAANEFRFIRISGIYLGFLFGLIQMVIWIFYKGWWVLPVAGFVVGYLTNWVALKVIFQPVQPIRICCCCTVQGLFLARQHQVATDYARLLSTRVLNAENLVSGLITGKLSDKFFTVLDENIQAGIDTVMPSRRVVRMVIGSTEYNSMKSRVSQLIRDDISKFLPHLTYVDEALDIRKTLETSMRGLSSEEFRDMLYPAFKEGEMQLVLIGAFLGVLVGMVQAVVQVPDAFGLGSSR